jgi:hypothetical protein
MAIEYRCEHCQDLAPAHWDVDKEHWTVPKTWWEVCRPGETHYAHLCSAVCVAEFALAAPVTVPIPGVDPDEAEEDDDRYLM